MEGEEQPVRKLKRKNNQKTQSFTTSLVLPASSQVEGEVNA